MDFTKVKTLLIVVFLCLNVFLFAQWRVLQANVAVYAEPISDQFANVQSALANSNVHVQAVLPSIVQPLSMVEVRLDPIPLSKDQMSAKVLNITPGQISVRDNMPVLTSAIDRKNRISVVRSWIAKHVYNGNTYGFLGWTVVKGERIAVFTQEVNGFPVFSAPLRVYLKGSRIEGYDQTLLSVRSIKAPKPVIGPVSALLSLAQYLQRAKISVPNQVKDVRLGYYSAIVTSVGFYLAPVWRIGTLRGVFFINAYTGEVEVALS